MSLGQYADEWGWLNDVSDVSYWSDDGVGDRVVGDRVVGDRSNGVGDWHSVVGSRGVSYGRSNRSQRVLATDCGQQAGQYLKTHDDALIVSELDVFTSYSYT